MDIQPPPIWLTVLNSSHNGLLVIDKKGTVIVYNEAARRIFGEHHTHYTGRHLTEIRPEVWPDFEQILKSGEPQIGKKLSLADATIIANRKPIIVDGEILGVISVFQDISEYEKIISQLKSYQRLNTELEAIIESSYDGLYITDGQARTIRVNRSYERITGLHREELVGRNMNDLVREEIFDHSVSLEVIRKKEMVTTMQIIMGDKMVMVTGTPIFDEAGEIAIVVTNVRDISELNALKTELETSRRITSRMCQTVMEQEGIEHALNHMVIKSQNMMAVVKTAIKVARTNAPVLIQGETGVGKSMLARIIHQISQRKENPFIKINCGAIPESLMESELFGYEKGAFTGSVSGGKAGLIEAGRGGTIFLDEIAELRPDLQVKLLEVIEEKTFTRVGGTKPVSVDVRIIAATNRQLPNMLKLGAFRKDLFYRLNVVPITIPPLRQRRDDIPPLVVKVVELFNQSLDTTKRLGPRVIDRLKRYDYPGNVRELINIVERMMIISEGDRITAEDLPEEVGSSTCAINDLVFQSMTLKDAVKAFEVQIIKQTLDRTDSIASAAAILDIHPTTLWRKMTQNGGLTASAKMQ